VSKPEVYVRTRSYEVTIWPEEMSDDIDAATWCLCVDYRGSGRWGVFRGSSAGRHTPCLGRDGTWSFGRPDDQDDMAAWLANYRFTEQEALDFAREQAPGMKVNGYFASDVLNETLDEIGARDA
jgi:hypothetical protein